MAQVETKIWYDLVNSKCGDEYLILYLGKQRSFRRIFKILTILFSASGAAFAFQDIKIPTIISCSLILLVQGATSIENFIIHSEDDLDSLSKLRILYYNRTTKLEELWHSLQEGKVTENEAADEFFELRRSKAEIEELDNKLNIKKKESILQIAEEKTNQYINTYYYE